MPSVKGKIYNVKEVLDLLEDLDSEDDVDISSERHSSEDENILDAVGLLNNKSHSRKCHHQKMNNVMFILFSTS